MAFHESVEKFLSNIAHPEGENQKAESGNRVWTPEEWFARSYQGQPRSEFPKHVFEGVSEEKIVELTKQYDEAAAAKQQDEQAKLNEGKQLDLFE